MNLLKKINNNLNKIGNNNKYFQIKFILYYIYSMILKKTNIGSPIIISSIKK